MASSFAPADEVDRVLVEQNPWQASGLVPEAFARSVERPLGRRLWRRLAHDEPRRYQLVLGPRRVGKTTVLYQTVRHLLRHGVAPGRLWWLRLDHPVLMSVPLGDLVRSLLDRATATAADPLYVFLDELVYADQWDAWLKTFYDEQWPVRIAATSSATAALRDRRRESGIGRWDEQHLMPYAFTEALELSGASVDVDVGDTLLDTLLGTNWLGAQTPLHTQTRTALSLLGGFPELLDAGAAADGNRDILVNTILTAQQSLRSDAIERAIYKDIPQSFGVDSPMTLERLLYVLAAQFTGVLSPTSISRDLEFSQPTFDRYLSYLEQAFLVFTLTNYSGSERGIQRRGRKLFFTDGAVRNAALHRGVTALDDPAERGRLTENLAASSLRSLGLATGVRVHYWRQGRREVDFVYDHPTEPVAFEIASSTRHSLAGLRALMEKHDRFVGRSYLVAPGATFRRPGEGGVDTGAVPLDAFLLAVGAQADHALDRRLGLGAGPPTLPFT